METGPQPNEQTTEPQASEPRAQTRGHYSEPQALACANSRAKKYAAQLGCLIFVLGGVLFAWNCSRRGDARDGDGSPLHKIAEVPEFSLIERDGRTVTRADLLGHVWIADFIFTTCAGPCPELSLRMRSLQQGVRKYNGNVKLVSFTVDPTYDQPPVLRAYAKRYEADPNLWWFLTSDDEATMYKLVQKGFLQALSPAQGGSPIIHSTRFVLVDPQGRIRAWYDGLEAVSKPLILRDVERLLNESA